ncbi:MAG: DUF3164 family protein [Desulfobulbaceae bacterium]|nr:DUF3164 family protein [Desulfobulbaceae bacterium]
MRWLNLLRKAVTVDGSQTAVAAKLDYHRSTISQVLSGTYQGSTSAIEAKVLQVYGGKTVEKIPDGYKRNALGHLVPIEAIKDEDLARDDFVHETLKKAMQVSALVTNFKIGLVDDMQAFLELSAEKYDAKLGGARGNVTLTSFDGKYQVLRAVSDQLDFDENLQAAKALIDECLRKWTSDSGPEVRAVIDDAFQVDKKGRINAKRILGLRKLKINDEKWLRAMDAINDSITVIGSRTYFRIYERDDRGNYRQIPLDFSGV